MKITTTLTKKNWKICTLSAYVMATTLCMAPLAFAAAPPMSQGAVNTKFKSTSDSAYGCNASSVCFNANSFDDLNGGLAGYISIYDYSSGLGYISCGGAAYGGVVFTNQINGNVSVKATLDPSDPSCFTSNWTASSVTVDLFGAYKNGGYYSSGIGNVTQYYNGTTYRNNYKSASFEETFIGSVTGFTGPFTGGADAYRSINRQQVN